MEGMPGKKMAKAKEFSSPRKIRSGKPAPFSLNSAFLMFGRSVVKFVCKYFSLLDKFASVRLHESCNGGRRRPDAGNDPVL